MSDFVRHLLDLLEGLDGVSARRMFGAHGLFRDGLMFGLVADDALYLKVDDRTRAEYEARGLPPFCYRRKGKTIAMGYRMAPEEALEDAEVLAAWARQACAAARRAGARG